MHFVYIVCGMICLVWLAGWLIGALAEVGRMFADVWVNGVWPLLRGVYRAATWLIRNGRLLAQRHKPLG